MSILYHVIYAGQVGIDNESLKATGIENLKKIHGAKFRRFAIDDTRVVFCDHPNDMEHVVNTLDDLQIPCASIFDETACVFTTLSFIVVGDLTCSPSLLDVISAIDSKI